MSTITVNNTSEFNLAIQSAHGGDTILLNAGNYSGVSLSNLNFSTAINIQSADTSHLATLSQLAISSSSGLNFSNLEFATGGSTDPYPVRVVQSQNLNFASISVHGSLDSNPSNDQSGLLIQNSSNVAFTRSEFQQLSFGIVVDTSTNITAADNYFHDIRSDGIHTGGSGYIQILRNYFTNFYPATGDHPDAVQFFDNGTIAGHDITVADNVVVRGTGGAIEGVFMRVLDTSPLRFQNVSINDNLLIGTAYDGITVLGATNLQVTGNELESLPDFGARVWIGNTDTTSSTSNKSAAFIYGPNSSPSFSPTNGNTNITVADDTTLAAVSDGGNAALQAWIASHPNNLPPALAALYGGGSTTTTTTTTTTAPPPPPEPDAVISSVTYTLGSASHSLTLTGTANIDGTGNNNGDTITGNVGANHLTGGTGADIISDGGVGGADTMTGKGGDDAYYVNNAADVVIENVGEGTDTVKSSVTYTLGANIENLVLTGSANIDGTGNGLGNHLTGNSGINHLYDGNGNDTLDGGAGADTMTGGAGNDTYFVDNAKDSVVEKAGQGTDVVYSIVTHSLGSNVENLFLTGNAAIDGNGNTLANSLTGNSAANHLTGGAGNDSIDGGAGNDTITGSGDNDALTGGAGNDVFKFQLHSGHDVVTDFKANGDADQIDISNYTSHRYAPTIVDHGTYTTVSFSTGDSIDLLGVHAVDVHLSGGFLI